MHRAQTRRDLYKSIAIRYETCQNGKVSYKDCVSSPVYYVFYMGNLLVLATV